MQTSFRTFRGCTSPHVNAGSQPPRRILFTSVLDDSARPQHLGVWSLETGRRQQLRPVSVWQKSDSISSSATSVRPRRQGKDASPPLPTYEDDIYMVPCAHLFSEQLQKHDIFTLSDFRRTYQREKSSFRSFLQDKLGVKEEVHVNAMESFFRALDNVASGTNAAANSSTSSSRDREQQEAEAVRTAVATVEANRPVGTTCEHVTLSVEGNIGAGKSTFLAVLERNGLLDEKGFSFVSEPIEQWQDVGGSGVNLLNLFYADPARLAYTFQNFVFLTRVLQERETYGLTQSARILERSIMSDRMVFVRAVVGSGDMAAHELAIYDAWFGPILSSLPTLIPNGLIYLRASPETCMARLKKRARSEECGIPLSYLQTLHRNHEDWLLQAAIPAATLKQQLEQQQQQQQGGLQQHPHTVAAASTSGASSLDTAATAERTAAEATSSSSSSSSSSFTPPSDAPPLYPLPATTSSTASRRPSLPYQAPALAAALSAGLRPLSEAPPPALALVDVPPAIADCLYIVDATKVPGVPSAGFLHQVPSLVVDCEADVDVDADVEHGRRVSQLIRDYTTFVAHYRAACHQLAAQEHPHSAAVRLPPPVADYFTTDPAGRVTYRPIVLPTLPGAGGPAGREAAGTEGPAGAVNAAEPVA